MKDMVMSVIMNFEVVVLWLAIVNIVIALLLLFLPNMFSKLNEMANRWISIEKVEEVLNRRRDIDNKVIKAQKIVGYISAALAVLLLFMYFKKM